MQVIFDFENDVLVDRGRIYPLHAYPKHEMLGNLTMVPGTYMREIRDASVIGLNIEDNLVTLYDIPEFDEEDLLKYPVKELRVVKQYAVRNLDEANDYLIGILQGIATPTMSLDEWEW